MEIIIHRINSIKKLREIPTEYGTEIDIRAFGSDLVLNHEPFKKGDLLKDYISEYKHGTLILNIKEAGIEDEVLKLVRSRPNIKSFFLLDVEFPYIYRACRMGERAIAIRYSEDESIETAKKYINMVNWIWIDTITRLPVDAKSLPTLNKFKKCLVCPERWGRESDINNYINEIVNLNFKLDAVMTSLDLAHLWEKY